MNRLPHTLSLALAGPLVRLGGALVAMRTHGNERLCILTYHRVLEQADPLLPSEVDLASFRWQMQLLARHFHPLPLSEAMDRLRERNLPPRAVCITFDDGYRSVHDLALPVLRQLGLPATVFVASAHIDGGSMWNDRILESVRRMAPGPVDLRAIGMDLAAIVGEQDRLPLAWRITRHAKYLPLAQREQVVAWLERSVGLAHQPDLMLDRGMVQALARAGLEIGGHTVSHPILAKLPDALARVEIDDNRRLLEAITGKPVTLFAYPNGKPEVDYDDRHVAMLRQAGFAAAFNTASGAADRLDDRFEIPRGRPWDKTPLRFALRLLYWLFKKGR